MNLAELVRLQAAQRPAATALSWRGGHWTYEQCWVAIATAIDALRADGVGAGDRIGVCLADTPEHVALHYAIAGCGATLVPIDHRNTDVEVARLAAAFAVGRLVTDTERNIDGVATVSAASLFAGEASDTVPAATTASTPWLISLSSGTTGLPKGAIVTHAQMRERFITQWVTLGFSTSDRFALVTPLVFGAGRSFAMSTLAAGGELVLAPPPLSPDELVAAINDFAATTTFLVPTLMRRLLALPGDQCLLPGLRRLLISGEAFFPHEVAAFKRRLSPHLIGYYASSEGGGISVLQPHDFDAHGATVGQAAFGVEVDIVDANGASLPAGDVGELRYRGPGVTSEGLDADGSMIAGHPDGWFYPGDLAERDPDGYIALRGRARDVINRAGVNVYPLEIEHALRGRDNVREAAVVAYTSADGRTEIAAFVAPETVDTAALAAALTAELAPYKRPKRIESLAELPRAASGKLDKRALTARAEAAS